MILFEALTLGTGQTFCSVVVSFLPVLAPLQHVPLRYDVRPKLYRILTKDTIGNVVFS